MASTPASRPRLMRQFFPDAFSSPYTYKRQLPAVVCSLPGLNRFLQLWYTGHSSEGPMAGAIPTGRRIIVGSWTERTAPEVFRQLRPPRTTISGYR